MENSSIDHTTTTTNQQLPISPLTHVQHQYPPHHPIQLADDQLLTPVSPPEVVVLLLETPNCNSSDNIPTTQPALGQLVVPIAENYEPDHSATNEFESPHSQNEQPGRGEIAVSIGDENQSIDLTLTGLHGCPDPKGVSYLLRVYLIFMALVAGKSPITNLFMIISIVVYAMAYTNLLILSCIYDGLPCQTFSPVHYKISKYIFYILCFLAHFMLLPLLFIPRD